MITIPMQNSSNPTKQIAKFATYNECYGGSGASEMFKGENGKYCYLSVTEESVNRWGSDMSEIITHERRLSKSETKEVLSHRKDLLKKFRGAGVSV